MTSLSAFGVRSLGRRAGLPSGQVHRCLPDHRGVMWFAGPSGLARYDGARMTTIGQKEGLSSNGLRCLGLFGDKVIVGTDNGVDLVAPDGTISSVPFGEAKPGFVQSVLTIGSTLLIGASRGMFSWTPADTPTDSQTPDSLVAAEVTGAGVSGHLVTDLAIDGHGRIWTCGPEIGVMFANTITGTWHAANVTLSALPRLFALRGGVLVTSGSHVLQVFGDGTSSSVVHHPGLETVTALWLDRTGLWMGSPSGLGCAPRHSTQIVTGTHDKHETRDQHNTHDQHYTHDTLRFGDFQSVLSSISVTDIAVDKEHNVWVATDANGVVRLSAMRDAFSRPLPSSAPVLCIKPAAGRSYLIGCEGEEWRLPNADGRRAGQPAEPIPSLAGGRIWDLHETDPGEIWAATQDGVFVASTTREAGNYETAPLQLVNHRVLNAPGRSLLEVGLHMWVGTLEGLVLVDIADLDRVIEVTEPNGTSLGYVYSLTQTSDRLVAVATLGNGLWWVDTATRTASRDSRVSDAANVYAVHRLRNANTAVLVDDKLVTLDADGRTTSNTTTSDRPLMGWSIAQEHSAALWVGSGLGLEYRPSPDFEPTRLINVMLEPEAWEFTTSRSLLIEESGSERHILCGVHGGLIEVLPDRLETTGPKPTLDRTAFKNATAQEHSSRFDVRVGKWSMDVTFSPRWFIDEERLEYRYRLLGFEADWTTTSIPQCAYTSLPVGEYTLEVQSYWGPSGWSDVTALMSVNVLRSSLSSAIRRTAEQFDVRRVFSSGERRARHELEQMVRARTIELSEAQGELLKLNRELEELSRIDSLTGVANRRFFQSTLESELAKSRRTGRPVSLIMIDIDYFKVLNDHFGHSVGDTCLQNVAWSLVRAVRDYTDVVARCGGEEFAVVLPGLDQDAASAVALRIGEAVRALHIEHPTSPFGVITVSSGVACHDPSSPATSMDASALFIAADRALYRAKDSGRDRIDVHS